MTGLRRFHPAYSVQLMRRWLAVCLLPLLNALRAFDLAAFRAALWQEGALLLALAAAAVLLWLPAGWKLEQGSLVICRGLAARRTLRLRPEEIASLEIRENPLSRLFGAAQMTLYPRRSGPKPKSLSLWLPRRAAHELAETLIPLREERPLYVPTRAGRLYLVLLTANGLVTGLLAFVSVQRSDQLAAAELKRMWAAAMQGLIGVERLAQRVLPVGLSWLFTLMGAVWFVGIAGGFLRSAGYRVYRGRAVILARGGLLTLRERRVRPGAHNAVGAASGPEPRVPARRGRQRRRHPRYGVAHEGRSGAASAADALVPPAAAPARAAHRPKPAGVSGPAGHSHGGGGGGVAVLVVAAADRQSAAGRGAFAVPGTGGGGPGGLFLRGPSPRAGRPAHSVLHKAVHPVSGVHLFAPAQCPDVSNALQ